MKGSKNGFLRVPSESFTNEISDQPLKYGINCSREMDSRITFNTDSTEGASNSGQLLNGNSIEKVDNPEQNGKPRDQWANKLQFTAGVLSYAVGLGNVWRFPYLCQKNGGGAFLIPYVLMMFTLGVPLFLIELGIGQQLRTGPVGVWNSISPYLGGVGISATIVSFLVSLYYNVIITWCIYYLSQSFTTTLPWGTCPTINGTVVHECLISPSTTNYFWNRVALQTSNSIEETDGLVNHMTICLIIAWAIIYLCIMRGIKSSGKVMYVTASFPYVVTTIFLFRSAMLKGALSGLKYLLSPDLSRLTDPLVWLEAATQIFYSMGLGFGGLIAFGSYNPYKNNCKKDCVQLALSNLATSFYTAIVIFCVLGYMGENNYNTCIKNDMAKILELYPGQFANLTVLENSIPRDQYIYWMENKFEYSEFSLMANASQYCNYKDIISQAAEGTGLAFIVFTEAVLQFPLPAIWAILFFLMLLMLGMGSMFGTLEGVITSLNDSHLITLKKPALSGIICAISCIIGLIFVTRAGQYWVSLFDYFAGSIALMFVAIFEIFAVVHVYGWKKFVRNLEHMTDEPVSSYWTITWRFVCPVVMIGVLVASLFKMFSVHPTYFAYDNTTGLQEKTVFPSWALIFACVMMGFTILPVPFVWFVRRFHIFQLETDIPAAQKFIDSTQSTARILKESSFSTINGGTVSEVPSLATFAISGDLINKKPA